MTTAAFRSTAASIEPALWESRRGIWDTVPGLPPTVGELLRHYFSTRRARLPEAPSPTLERLLGVILAAYGSALGIEPYEMCHRGGVFVAFLLGQALLFI